MSYFRHGPKVPFQPRDDALRTSRLLDAWVEGVLATQHFGLIRRKPDLEPEEAQEQDGDEQCLSRVSTRTSDTIVVPHETSVKLIREDHLQSDSGTDSDTDVEADNEKLVRDEGVTGMEEVRPVESGHKLRDTIRRILHTRPSFSFHLGEKGLWRESKSGQHGVEHDFCVGNELIDFETQPERQHAAAAGMFMLDDSPGKPPIMLARKILDHIPGFSDDQDSFAQSDETSSSQRTRSEQDSEVLSRPCSSDYTIEVEDRAIVYQTALCPPPWRRRERTDNSWC